jgi:hypothetical protein
MHRRGRGKLVPGADTSSADSLELPVTRAGMASSSSSPGSRGSGRVLYLASAPSTRAICGCSRSPTRTSTTTARLAMRSGRSGHAGVGVAWLLADACADRRLLGRRCALSDCGPQWAAGAFAGRRGARRDAQRGLRRAGAPVRAVGAWAYCRPRTRVMSTVSARGAVRGRRELASGCAVGSQWSAVTVGVIMLIAFPAIRGGRSRAARARDR